MREPTEHEIETLRATFESHARKPPRLWTRFARDEDGYECAPVQRAWYWLRMGFAAGINSTVPIGVRICPVRDAACVEVPAVQRCTDCPERRTNGCKPEPDARLVPIATLRQHWLSAMECDHATSRDKPHCSCSQVDLGWHPSIGAAVEAWLAHVAGVASTSTASEKGGNNDGR